MGKEEGSGKGGRLRVGDLVRSRWIVNGAAGVVGWVSVSGDFFIFSPSDPFPSGASIGRETCRAADFERVKE